MNNKPNVLITGASGGIGYDLCKEFAMRGFDIVAVARNEKSLKALKAELKGKAEVIILAGDLTRPRSAEKMYAAVKKQKIVVDVLVNNAGFGSNGVFTSLDRANELSMIELNITALVNLCHLFGSEMVKEKNGRILNVASTAAFQPGPLMSNYYATKAYVLMFSEGLAEELRPFGVQVSVLCPGATLTGFQKRASTENAALFKSPGVMTSQAVARYAVRKFLKGKMVIIPGIMNKILAQSIRFSPRFLARKIAKRLNMG